MNTITLAPRGTRARQAADAPTLFDAPAPDPTIPDPERQRIAARAWSLKERVLGLGAIFPQRGEPLRALWRAAKGDAEVRAYLMSNTWAGRWAAMIAGERKETDEAC